MSSRKRENEKKLDKQLAILDELRGRFPLCFPPLGHPPLPLKVGIGEDIAARLGQPQSRFSGILWHYAGRFAYLDALTNGALRVDLDGNPAGAVSAEQAKEAARRSLGLRAAEEMAQTVKRLQRAVDGIAAALEGVRILTEDPDDRQLQAFVTAGAVRAIRACAALRKPAEG